MFIKNLFYDLPYELQDKILTFSNPYKKYYKRVNKRCLNHLLLKLHYNIPNIYIKYLNIYIYYKEQNIIKQIYCSCGSVFHIEEYVEYKIINNKKTKNKYFRPIKDLIEGHINNRHFENIKNIKDKYFELKKKYDKIIESEKNNYYNGYYTIY